VSYGVNPGIDRAAIRKARQVRRLRAGVQRLRASLPHVCRSLPVRANTGAAPTLHSVGLGLRRHLRSYGEGVGENARSRSRATARAVESLRAGLRTVRRRM